MAIVRNPWKGPCAITGKSAAWFEDALTDCAASDAAKRAAVSICRSYGIKGLCDPAYIANTIAAALADKDDL